MTARRLYGPGSGTPVRAGAPAPAPRPTAPATVDRRAARALVEFLVNVIGPTPEDFWRWMNTDENLGIGRY